MGPVTDPLIALTRLEAHVWYTRPELIADPLLLDTYSRLLSTEEQTRHQRIVLAKDRHQYLVARALLRASLSRHAAISPEQWRFVADEHGKPELAVAVEPLLRFNLTHTDGLVACVIAVERAVGIDAEDVERRDLPASPEDLLSPSEAGRLSALPCEARRRRFFELWTLREAYFKARGVGLSPPIEPIEIFSFTIGATEQIDLRAVAGGDGAAWQVALFRPTSRHVLAVAVRRGGGPDLTIQTHEVIPLRYVGG